MKIYQQSTPWLVTLFFLSKMKGGQSAPENVNEQTSFPVPPVTVSLVYPSLGNFFSYKKEEEEENKYLGD